MDSNKNSNQFIYITLNLYAYCYKTILYFEVFSFRDCLHYMPIYNALTLIKVLIYRYPNTQNWCREPGNAELDSKLPRSVKSIIDNFVWKKLSINVYQSL